MTVEELKLEIEQLSEEDRATIHYYLIDLSVGFDDASEAEIEAAWLDECNRRAAEIKTGTVKLISAKEVHEQVINAAAERLINRTTALSA
jgi:hypothetical protein